ncbi:MAG TPA: hypothetical protein ENJ56_05110, partial [Anaerolineae bacterium]|nr:hypothetical protein [Anaerolineae bacterium]
MPHRTHSKKRSAQAVIFLAPNLDAQQFVNTYYQFQAAGYHVTTVAVRAGAIGCRYGVRLCSDYTVSSYLRVVGSADFEALIILGDT